MKEPAIPTHQKPAADVSVIGNDIGKTTFHLLGQNRRGKNKIQATEPMIALRVA